ncbi:MAG: type IV secretory system conjugative DNA transfer family protein [Lachnospiraceae bacterium]|nr:type IV secretory system conjugative DNA transfer family protein [Lachnospiraceae bacterium]
MPKKKEKYQIWVGDDDYDASKIDFEDTDDISNSPPRPPNTGGIPPNYVLGLSTPGLVFGVPPDDWKDILIGMPQGYEGNIAVIGGNGSGKSYNIAKPTLKRWTGPLCVTDIKGELSEEYAKNYKHGRDRPHIIFDLLDPCSPSYDPLALLIHDDQANLISNVWEMTYSIIPHDQNAKEPFWEDAERALLAAAILYYFKLGLSFSEIMCTILSSSASSLCAEIVENGGYEERSFLGDMSKMKEETLANVDRGLHNKLIPLVTDRYIGHAFRGEREGAKCFTWNDLEHYNIFIRVPEYRMEQYSAAINLMYTQLIRYLERRAEKHSEAGASIQPTLILMDEVARFGKLKHLVSALSTLRSKKVNLCLMLQSIAQLNMIYGKEESKVILDNCQYKAILRANDAETQKYLSDLIGTHVVKKESHSYHYDECLDETGSSTQTSESREHHIPPHDLALLKDVAVLTPDGFFRVGKINPDNMTTVENNNPTTSRVKLQVTSVKISTNSSETKQGVTKLQAKAYPKYDEQAKAPKDICYKNEEVTVLTMEERTENANSRVNEAQHQQRAAQRAERQEKEKANQRRNFILGEIMCKHFPEVMELEPGTAEENEERFALVENIMLLLSSNADLMDDLKEKARQMMTVYGEEGGNV